jgi:hypothetical protein
MRAEKIIYRIEDDDFARLNASLGDPQSRLSGNIYEREDSVRLTSLDHMFLDTALQTFTFLFINQATLMR